MIFWKRVFRGEGLEVVDGFLGVVGGIGLRVVRSAFPIPIHSRGIFLISKWEYPGGTFEDFVGAYVRPRLVFTATFANL